jgi:DNA (cytosine-5)-methyltransferase 1
VTVRRPAAAGHGTGESLALALAAAAATHVRPRDRTFDFVDLFAGIGGIRGGLEKAGGRCVFSVELDGYATRTYRANWGPVDHDDVTTLTRAQFTERVGEFEVLAAGFPCQPFSLAGVSKKQSMGRAHGFDDPTSGNLFFEIVRLIGGPVDLGPDELRHEAEAPDEDETSFMDSGSPAPSAPPVLLLENVRHLLSHDSGRTYRVIRRRLKRSGYFVSEKVVNAAAWVPQNRRRTMIVGLRRDLFPAPFAFPAPPDPSTGPRLTVEILEKDPAILEKYRITLGTWEALKKHQARHARQQNGFGFSLAELGSVTRTLSARYYKDGAEILLPLPDGSLPPRRLTPGECALLMGFTEAYLGKVFIIPEDVSDARAYRQFGNSVVVPQFQWIGEALAAHARGVFAPRLRSRGRG